MNSNPAPLTTRPGGRGSSSSALVVLGATMGLGLTLAASPADAYWELIPQIEVGATWEDNPRYFSDEQKSAQEALSPGSTDDVLGTYTDLRLEGHWETPASQITVTPRIRRSDYLKANDDLNDDNKFLDVAAERTGTRGVYRLTGFYRDTAVRTSEFEEATPTDPDLPPDVSGGSGRFADRTQKTWSIAPSFGYQLSPRNLVNLAVSYADTTYDKVGSANPLARSYLDYDYTSVDLSLRHTLDAKNALSIGLNSSNFEAMLPGNPFRNASDSYGVTVVYDRVFSQRLSGNITAGTTRNSVQVSGIVGGVDPVSYAPCFPFSPCVVHSEEENVVGSLGLRWRAELTTLNLDLSRNIAPRSDGTEVVQDQLRFFVNRTMTRRFSMTFATMGLKETAVGKFFQPGSANVQLIRQDRTYVTFDLSLNWKLTPTLSAYSSYTHRMDREDEPAGNVAKANNRLF